MPKDKLGGSGIQLQCQTPSFLGMTALAAYSTLGGLFPVAINNGVLKVILRRL